MRLVGRLQDAGLHGVVVVPAVPVLQAGAAVEGHAHHQRQQDDEDGQHGKAAGEEPSPCKHIQVVVTTPVRMLGGWYSVQSDNSDVFIKYRIIIMK